MFQSKHLFRSHFKHLKPKGMHHELGHDRDFAHFFSHENLGAKAVCCFGESTQPVAPLRLWQCFAINSQRAICQIEPPLVFLYPDSDNFLQFTK